MDNIECLMPYVTQLHLIARNDEGNGLDLLQSDYFSDNFADLHQIKGILEMLEEPLLINKGFDGELENRQFFQCLIYHFKNLMVDEIPSNLSEKQKFESICSEALKCNAEVKKGTGVLLKRINELLLFKIKRCLEKGQIERAKKIARNLSFGAPASRNLVEDTKDYFSYLERVRKLLEEGHSSKKSENKKGRIPDFNNQEKDWTFEMFAAANLDSGNNVQVLQV